jgi:hypothetical protein
METPTMVKRMSSPKRNYGYRSETTVAEEFIALGELLAEVAREKGGLGRGWYYHLQDQTVLALRRHGYRRAEIAKLLGFASDVACGVYLYDRQVKLEDAVKPVGS